MNSKSMRISLRKSLNKNPTMGVAAPPTTSSDQSTLANTKPITNKPLFSFQFPTSPQPTVGQELLYLSSHPQHPLARVLTPDSFTCTGCKEPGAGKRVCCQICEFQLHEFCALSPFNSALNYHPLHAQHQLLFQIKSKPDLVTMVVYFEQGKGGMLWSKCSVCGKAIKGFTFKCHACSFQIHPCCAMLSTEMKFPIHPHTLKLLPSTSSGPYTFVCSDCRRKQPGSKIYVCTACDNYYLHAVCAKNVINGLRAHRPAPLEKPSRLRNAAHAASIVFMDFLGGLIEGIGEGVGEAIFQNIGRGRDINDGDTSSNFNRRKTTIK